jgi:hypothetical protein
METYLFITLAFIYLLSIIFLPKYMQKRIWTVAYITAFGITCVAIYYIKDYATDTLMKVGEINWYYILYVFGSISIILGVINIWMYRHELLGLFLESDDEDDA